MELRLHRRLRRNWVLNIFDPWLVRRLADCPDVQDVSGGSDVVAAARRSLRYEAMSASRARGR
jgi:hypothetical protein